MPKEKRKMKKVMKSIDKESHNMDNKSKKALNEKKNDSKKMY